MSSWAEVAASGPPQSEEEALVILPTCRTRGAMRSRANPVDEVIPVESSVGSLVDVDSGVSVVESGFLEKEIKTETQARRLELEAEAAEKAAKEEKKTAKKQKADKKPTSSSSLSSQFQNPIVLANAVTVATVSAVLGFVGFKKHQAGQLSWKAIGLGSVFVTAFGTADYFISNYLFKKHPPKK